MKQRSAWFPKVMGVLALVSQGCAVADAPGPWGLAETRQFARSQAELAPVEKDVRSLSIVLPLGTQRAQFALVARERLSVERGAKVTEPRFDQSLWGAPVASFGQTVIGEDARVGSIYGLGVDPVVLEMGASASGFVKSSAGVQQAKGAFIRSGRVDDTPRFVEGFRWRVTPAGARQSSPTPSAEPRLLLPGVYGALVIGPGGAVSLSRGRYFIDRLELQAGASLTLDNTSGPIYLWVQSGLEISGKLVRLAEAANVLWGFAGSAAHIASPFIGALVAPQVELMLPATEEPHRGSFFARSITLAEGASVEHWGFFVGVSS